ncbi:MAG: hypothetical protein DCC64_00005 [Planctomycetota bacterium]|nr:MAG: hypothetical protein DCC64_00005 [Planctomycetota bacterium]
MPDPHPSDQRQRAVLAAVLAVKRGFLSPDEAMGILEQVEEPASQARTRAHPPATGATLLNLGSGEDAANDASSLILARATPSARAEMVQEIEQLAQNPAKAAETLGFGDAATRLAGHDAVKQTLLAVAATSHLDKKRASARLAAVQKGAERYEVRRELARGGMGRVLIAMDNAVGREVALKELLAHNEGTTLSQRLTSAGELADRFLREAKVTGQLEHPNIIPVYEIGTRENGSVFYTMKLIRGTTLAERIRQITDDAKLSEAARFNARLKLLEPFVDVCNALAYAHSRGVIHRDIKPANVMLGDFGETLVLDWGLARVKGQADEAAPRAKQDTPNFSPSLVGTESESRTLDGSVIGTPAYMPPEQALGELSEVDEQSDVYSLGATLYEIVAGRPPYEGKTANQILGKVQNVGPEPLPAHAPADLRALVARAMARAKGDRLPSAQALGDEVRAFREGRPLSVYRYTRGEKARKFVARNRVATVATALALAAIIGVTALSFVNILDERNEARQALARAEKAERERTELERNQRAEHERLLGERLGKVRAQEKTLAALEQGKAAEGAQQRIRQFTGVASLSDVSPSEIALNRQLVGELLAICAARSEYLRLLTEPVAGLSPEFVSREELSRLRRTLMDERLMAATLSRLSEDYALAQVILDETPSVDERFAQERQRLSDDRGAQMKRHADVISATLARVRADRAASLSAGADFDELVMRLSMLRERQTVDMLTEALGALAKKALTRESQLLWTQPERDEITLICRVLANMEMPENTVGPLSEFLNAVDDERLAIEAAVALCRSASWKAEAPVLRARKRFETRALFWSVVGRVFARIPDPPSTSQPRSASEYLERGLSRYFKRREAEAWADATEAIKLDPDNADAYLFRAQMGSGSEEKDMADLRRALAINPKMARAYVRMAQLVQGRNNNEDMWQYAQKATEVDPQEASGWAVCAWVRYTQGRHREAIAFYDKALSLNPYRAPWYNNRGNCHSALHDHVRAVVDYTSALDCDPFNQEAWVNRADARLHLGDLEGALADATRIIELAPRYGWGYAKRGEVRARRRDLIGAEYDFGRAVQFVHTQGDFMYRHVQSLRALKRFEDAASLAGRYAAAHELPSEAARLRDLREEVLLEKRGSLSARPGEVSGMAALECCAAQLGEVERLAPGARHPLRLARQFLMRALLSLPEGDDRARALSAATIVGAALIKTLRAEGYFAEIGDVGRAMHERGIVTRAGVCYDLGCFTALAASATQQRRLKVLGERDEDVAELERELRELPQVELERRTAALKDQALVWLSRAFELGFRNGAHAAQDSDLACLHDDPRFAEWLAKMK